MPSSDCLHRCISSDDCQEKGSMIRVELSGGVGREAKHSCRHGSFLIHSLFLSRSRRPICGYENVKAHGHAASIWRVEHSRGRFPDPARPWAKAAMGCSGNWRFGEWRFAVLCPVEVPLPSTSRLSTRKTAELEICRTSQAGRGRRNDGWKEAWGSDAGASSILQGGRPLSSCHCWNHCWNYRRGTGELEEGLAMTSAAW